MRILELAESGFLNAPLTHSVHTRKEGRDFFFISYCLLVHVTHMQLEEAWCKMFKRANLENIAPGFYFHRCIPFYERLGVISFQPETKHNYSFVLPEQFSKDWHFRKLKGMPSICLYQI